MKLHPLAFVALAPLASSQQHVCEGNGLAPLSIAVSTPYLGGTLEIDLGAPTAPGGVVLLAKATAVGPVFHPLLGWGCLDVFAPGLQLFALPLDGAGKVHVSVALPPEPAFVGRTAHLPVARASDAARHRPREDRRRARSCKRRRSATGQKTTASTSFSPAAATDRSSSPGRRARRGSTTR